MADSHQHHAPGLPEVHDEAGESPWWLPLVGIVVILSLVAMIGGEIWRGRREEARHAAEAAAAAAEAAARAAGANDDEAQPAQAAADAPAAPAPAAAEPAAP